ncbi:hypothetical protein CRENPOLYSF2_2440013 [Crenothrix polyspora]|uniref:DUF4062 domain-containing protein n=1 Tax=Crenothrix polyspora TaxID=360316 RepID=A0A1R4H6N8_9GAMM|nr:DUF4062 domain-containing protein [Crenothrix polyspora]SJM91948.1 hypothetical protein CRENPOLYSF2_2440013 [Crenothrix polyspora]
MTQTIKIMISSTRQDLDEYRKVASEVIKQLASEKKERVQLIEVSMEEKSQSGERETALAVSKGWVNESNWVVLVVGWWYGTISTEAEAEGQAITEFEYRYAMKLKESDPDRKIFVFVTGNEGSPEEYAKSTEEKNLLFWIGKGTVENREKLNKFRSFVTGPHTTFFNDIHVFREKLRLTLQEAIDTLPNPIPSEFFLKLILDLQVPINKCILRVNRLETYKQIHDQLHKMRQFVIRPLREGILSQWEEQGLLSRELERRLNGRLVKASELQGQIKVIMKGLGTKSPSLTEQLKVIVDTKLLDEEDAEPKLEDFSHKLEDFSGLIQAAFTEANDLMDRMADLLDKFHGELLKDINERKNSQLLTDEQIKQLDPELNRIETERKQFIETLTIHDNWQKIHNGFELVDAFKETKYFDMRLRQFCLIQKVTVSNEINAESQRLTNENPDHSDLNVIEQLKVYWNKLGLSISIEDYEAVREDYETMRKEFDDYFYKVDERTLKEVEKAGESAEKFKQLLEALRAKEYGMQPSSKVGFV